MSSSRTRPDHPVVLPSSSAWNADARLVGEVLQTVGSAAACTSDDTRYLHPTLTWQIAAETVLDCATNDYRPGRVRALPLRGYALNAVWACHAALLQAADTAPDSDDDAGRLAGLLAFYLDSVHHIEVPALIGAVERVLAVLSLDLPAARTLITHLVLNPDVGPEARSAYDDVRAAWRRAGVVG
ncbi:hypothetical protein QFZ75_000024 [Streptomyces sp. V3I8]|uniref:hypothetical protein n=1 Tax=Streptomyces sp. V3I8 TaxID=3042279 RepID=UPI00278A6631|nr:hypothetical protein [Streptomyces sp. V3I8]MDQ1033608.1 hypothetical protein [Streptomyces sp. V3I8]